MFKNFKPINDNILVELIEAEKKTAAGIFVPVEAQEKTQKAKVIHPGKSEQLCFNETIFFKKYLGTALDDKYLVLREEDILGVL